MRLKYAYGEKKDCFSFPTEQGRIFWDIRLPKVSAAERAALYVAAVETLAKLHSLNLASLNLEGYGKGLDYCRRQVGHDIMPNNSKYLCFILKNVYFHLLKVSTWTKQYSAAAHKDIPAMNELSDWLMKNLPAKDNEVTLVHGDFRMDNLVFHPTEVKVYEILLVQIIFF